MKRAGTGKFLPLQSGEWTLQGQKKGKSKREGGRRLGTHTHAKQCGRKSSEIK